MASQAVGTSLGRNPFKVQDTFTWEDLRQGLEGPAEKARYSWEVNDLPKNEEAHFFELWMDVSEDQGEFVMVLSVRLHPYDYLILSETTSFQAARARDLTLPVMAYMRRLFGVALAKRATRQYGGKMLEWLESAETLYRQGNETRQGLQAADH